MARYAYKSVCYRPDFQAVIKDWEKSAGYECDNDGNYDGDYWYVTEYLLDKKDREIEGLKDELRIQSENPNL